VYSLKLVYHPEPYTHVLKESITYCAVIELLVHHGIDCVQTSASELVFESERDRFFASLVLSDSASFCVVYSDTTCV
jgi:hypothetical protein